MIAPNYPAQSAVNYAFSSVSNGCKNPYTGAVYGSRYVVYRTSTINAITAQIGAGVTTNFNTSVYYIRADTAGNPGAVVATFVAGTVSGGLARFTGSYAAASGSKFWVTPGQAFSTLQGCYGQPLTNADLTNDGSMNVDSQTGLTTVYYSQSNDGAVTWGNGAVSNFLFQIGIEANGSDTSTITLSGISPNVSPLIYKSTYTISAALSTPGKTNFYAQGKVIPGCKNVVTATTTATCSWKPATHGAVSIYATLKPTDAALKLSTSLISTFGVATRSSNR